MSTTIKAVPKPRPPGPRRERLDSLSNPQPRPPIGSRRKEPLKCPDPTCKGDEFGEEDGKKLCLVCGAVVSEFSMVTDVQFGLTGSGRHVVHGAHVAADQAYNRGGNLYDRNKQTTSEEVTNMAGRRYMELIREQLRVAEPLMESGMQVFRLASANNFIQGRRTKSVAAVCLYLACRSQRDLPNPHMLIDFADVLNLDVFGLGNIYKGLIKVIRLNDHNYFVPPINPEDLVLRFTGRLEFGDQHMRVAKDAVRIIQRMTRDWMTHGRRPAGICGAAIILAARMNNFRRTVREVVYVVKVQEQTLFKRLDEFKVTESSALTVEEFRNINLEREMEPPAFYEQQSVRQKRSRKRKADQYDDDGDDSGPPRVDSRDASAVTAEAGQAASGNAMPNQAIQTVTPANTQKALSDHRSMPPPPLPIDPSLLEAANQARTAEAICTSTHQPAATSVPPEAKGKGKSQPAPKKARGRPRKSPPALPLDESQILSTLTDPLNVESTMEITANPSSSPANQPQPPIDPSLSTSIQPQPPPHQRRPIPDDPDISDSEFADDPEVTNCLLSPAEHAIKVRIWTHENSDWLRSQSAKQHKAALAELNGTARIIKRRIRRRGRVGDMTKYGVGAEGGVEAGSPVAQSPEEAVRMMMERRGYSKKLNYDIINDVYGGSPSSTASRSRATSATAAGSPGAESSSPPLSPPSAGVDGDDAGEEEDDDVRPAAVTRSQATPSVDPEEEGGGVVGGDDGRRRIVATAAEPAETENQDAVSEAGTLDDERQREIEQLVGEMQEEGFSEDDEDVYDEGGAGEYYSD